MIFTPLFIVESITAALTAVITVALGILVYKSNPNSATNRLFALLCVDIFLWVIVMFLSLNQDIFPNTLLWIRFSMFFAIIQATLLFLFCHTIPNQTIALPRKWFITIFSITTFTMFLTLTQFLFSTYEITDNFPNPKPELGMAFFTLYAITLLGASAYQLWEKSSKTQGVEKQKLLFVLFGFVIMYSLIIMTIVIPINLFRYPYFVPYYFLYLLAFLLPTAYAITRYRFMDIRVALRKSVITFCVLVVALLIVAVILVVLKNIIATELGISNDLVVLFAMIILLFIFPGLKQAVERFINNRIFSDRIDLSIPSHEVTALEQHNQLIAIGYDVAKQMRDKYGVEQCWFLVYDHINKNRLITYWPKPDGGHGQIVLDFTDPIVLASQDNLTCIITNQLPDDADSTRKAAHKKLERMNVALALPYGQKRFLFGMVLLGPKPNNVPFTGVELQELYKLAKSLQLEVPQTATVQVMIDDAIRAREAKKVSIP